MGSGTLRRHPRHNLPPAGAGLGARPLAAAGYFNGPVRLLTVQATMP